MEYNMKIKGPNPSMLIVLIALCVALTIGITSCSDVSADGRDSWQERRAAYHVAEVTINGVRCVTNTVKGGVDCDWEGARR